MGPLCPDWPDYSKNHISRTKKELGHSENGPWDFVGTTRRPGHFPGCHFRSFGAKKLLVPMCPTVRLIIYYTVVQLLIMLYSTGLAFWSRLYYTGQLLVKILKPLLIMCSAATYNILYSSTATYNIIQFWPRLCFAAHLPVKILKPLLIMCSAAISKTGGSCPHLNLKRAVAALS